jgi:hypothetical protein
MMPSMLTFRVLAVAAAVLLLPVAMLAAQPARRIPVIVDTDANNELDDQHAIAYLLFNGPTFDVEGITVNRTKSGGDIGQQYAEAVRVVRLCGLDARIPIRRGASGAFEDIRGAIGRPGFDGEEAVEFLVARARAADARRLVVVAVGKLTNVALALARAPDIAPKIRLVWLGSNYPKPGEYNQENDEPALNSVLDSNVDFEIALVRYGEPSGTDAVRAAIADVRRIMPGKGPRIGPAVTGRHGGEFSTFGDYSVNLFEHIELGGDPPSRALFDMAAVAVVKQPKWAAKRTIPAPILEGGKWNERPANARSIVLWENFDRTAIMTDFYDTMTNWKPVRAR